MGAANIIRLVESLPWNPSRPRWPQQRDLEKIDRVILHQSLGHADPSGNRDVFGINNYHVSPGNHISAGGCPHICYHLVVDDDGSIYQTNELTDVVWHCKGQNSRSIGIMLVGNFAGPGHSGGEPTEAQEQAFIALTKHLVKTLGLAMDGFFGHRDFGKLACPGTTAYGWIKKLRG
ncbi:MAG: peptidoglycan recognition family protein [Candidatus Alcyoniella australis]|nr:peptidoglycan recognition family protein [Candidatus Alcyoniella australis]